MDEPLPVPRPIKYLFTVGIFAVFGFILFKYRESFYTIRNISVSQFVSASLLTLLVMALNGSKLNRIVSSFDVRLQTKEWFALSSITTVLNSVFFKAGSLTISTYLKKIYNLEISLFSMILLMEACISLIFL